MTTTMLLRIAAAISLLFAAGHSVEGLEHWSPMESNAVLTAMTDVRFQVMGVSRSYLDLFVGLGWTVGVYLLLQAVLLWLLAPLARTHAAQLRPMIAAFALANLAAGLIAWVYILAVPAAFCAVLTVVLVAAFWTSGRPVAAAASPG